MPDAIRIRPARAEEFAACRLLLPLEGPNEPVGDYLLAVQDQAPFIVGAATYIPGLRATHGIRVRVIRTHRRRGVGLLLMARIEELSRERGAESLFSLTDSVQEPDAEPFLTALGFRLIGRSHTVCAPMEAATRIVFPLADRLMSRMPPDEKIVPLSEAPINAVTALYRSELARSPLTTPWGLLDVVAGERFAKSPVLLIGDRVAGFILVYGKDGDETGVIAARVVDPEFQRGSTNVLLMAQGLRTGLHAGTKYVEFDVPENNYDTENLARRLEAQLVRTRSHYARAL